MQRGLLGVKGSKKTFVMQRPIKEQDSRLDCVLHLNLLHMSAKQETESKLHRPEVLENKLLG